MWNTLEAIPETYREALVLYYREDHSIAEVAAALDIQPDAAKQRLARGREMLRETLAATVEGVLKKSKPGRALNAADHDGRCGAFGGAEGGCACDGGGDFAESRQRRGERCCRDGCESGADRRGVRGCGGRLGWRGGRTWRCVAR